MPCTSPYNNIELFVESGILKVRYLFYVPKYGFEKEGLKNVACMLEKKNNFFKLLKYRPLHISLALSF